MRPTDTRWASAISARMPPSPRLSARITRKTYFSVTMTISDQKISDSTPMISTRVVTVGVEQLQAGLEGVERTGADVAVDDAQHRHQHAEAWLGRASVRVLRVLAQMDDLMVRR